MTSAEGQIDACKAPAKSPLWGLIGEWSPLGSGCGVLGCEENGEQDTVTGELEEAAVEAAAEVEAEAEAEAEVQEDEQERGGGGGRRKT